MNVNQAMVGKKVKFSPASENFERNYSLDGVSVGDTGTIVGVDSGDVLVNFVRRDGTVSECFYAFPEDLEVIK